MKTARELISAIADAMGAGESALDVIEADRREVRAEAQNDYLADRFADLLAAAKKEGRVEAFKEAAHKVRAHGCRCPNSNPFSGEEWDRHHATWCPIVLGRVLWEKNLQEGIPT